MWTRGLGTLVVLAALVAGPTRAAAHAGYRDASPAADTRVVGAPRYVLVTFTEEVKTISLVVRGPGGVVVTNGPASIDPTDRTNVSVQIHDGGDGRYEVEWDLVSAFDLDTSSGSFGFWVGLPAAAASGPVTPVTPVTAPVVAPAVTPVVAPPMSAPPPADVARDGRSLAGEPPSTQALFRALWGDRAAIEWAAEHNAELSRGG